MCLVAKRGRSRILLITCDKARGCYTEAIDIISMKPTTKFFSLFSLFAHFLFLKLVNGDDDATLATATVGEKEHESKEEETTFTAPLRDREATEKRIVDKDGKIARKTTLTFAFLAACAGHHESLLDK